MKNQTPNTKQTTISQFVPTYTEADLLFNVAYHDYGLDEDACYCLTYRVAGTCRHTSNYTISDEEQTLEDASYRSQ